MMSPEEVIKLPFDAQLDYLAKIPFVNLKDTLTELVGEHTRKLKRDQAIALVRTHPDAKRIIFTACSVEYLDDDDEDEDDDVIDPHEFDGFLVDDGEGADGDYQTELRKMFPKYYSSK